jgi:hypothetical protein
MSADQASGAYLGGIGTMLEAADICPSCGKVHADRQYAFLHRGSGQCPSLIESTYSVVSRPSPAIEAHLVPSLPKATESDVPVSMGSLPVPPRSSEGERRTRTLALPFLPPPDLGGLY